MSQDVSGPKVFNIQNQCGQSPAVFCCWLFSLGTKRSSQRASESEVCLVQCLCAWPIFAGDGYFAKPCVLVIFVPGLPCCIYSWDAEAAQWQNVAPCTVLPECKFEQNVFTSFLSCNKTSHDISDQVARGSWSRCAWICEGWGIDQFVLDR